MRLIEDAASFEIELTPCSQKASEWSLGPEADVQAQYDRSNPAPANHVEVNFFEELLSWIGQWNATEGQGQLESSVSVAGMTIDLTM